MDTFIALPDKTELDLQIEIGDSKDDVFYPQVKFMKWDNECNLSIRLTGFDPDSVVIGDTTKLVSTDAECSLYEKVLDLKTTKEGLESLYAVAGECNDCGECCGDCEYRKDGICSIYDTRPERCREEYPTVLDLYCGKYPNCSYYLEERETVLDTPSSRQEDVFEFDTTLLRKPNTNVLTYTLEFKGIRFSYQPKLTQARIDAGYFRLPNVEGSYAVFHESKRDNKYKAGKLLHIYRPQIFDANGDWVYGGLNIDGKLMTVTVPQDFLDTAVYPVTVDPTFGYTVAGGTEAVLENRLEGTRATGGAGTLDKFTVYLSVALVLSGSGDADAKCALYLQSDASLVSGTESAETQYPDANRAAQWDDFVVSGSPSVSAVSYYVSWLRGGSTTGKNRTTIRSYFDDDVAGTIHGTTPSTYVDGFPDPAGFDATDNRYSIYATYTATGAGPAGVKTINDTAIASVKTLNDTAIASVKTINDSA